VGSGDGFGYGINDAGALCGESSAGATIWQQWYPFQAYAPLTAPGVLSWLFKVDAFGNAVGNEEPQLIPATGVVINAITGLVIDLDVVGSLIDINNHYKAVGNGQQGAFIYDLTTGSTTWLPNGTLNTARGINDLGDVVGNVDSAGFFYSNSEMISIETDLRDININRLAVGGIVINDVSGAAMVNLANAAPVPQAIPTPFPYAVATAVNSSNTIVGLCTPPDANQWCAWVSYNGEPALNLNDLLAVPSEYTLIDAMDINEAGQIVGTADNGTDVYAYVASPFTVPPPPPGPVRAWPFPIWVWPWGWLPSPGIPPSQFPGPSPQIGFASLTSGMPITGKRFSRLQNNEKRTSHVRKRHAEHRARLLPPRKH
jgi:hypothetical protein